MTEAGLGVIRIFTEEFKWIQKENPNWWDKLKYNITGSGMGSWVIQSPEGTMAVQQENEL